MVRGRRRRARHAARGGRRCGPLGPVQGEQRALRRADHLQGGDLHHDARQGGDTAGAARPGRPHRAGDPERADGLRDRGQGRGGRRPRRGALQQRPARWRRRRPEEGPEGGRAAGQGPRDGPGQPRRAPVARRRGRRSRRLCARHQEQAGDDLRDEADQRAEPRADPPEARRRGAELEDQLHGVAGTEPLPAHAGEHRPEVGVPAVPDGDPEAGGVEAAEAAGGGRRGPGPLRPDGAQRRVAGPAGGRPRGAEEARREPAAGRRLPAGRPGQGEVLLQPAGQDLHTEPSGG
mmetsp:Transcript_13477/g.41754  ORF Transcript_13477/g.41754 Transcript_13477/m.41754 type:complete len:291 (-) Transcript_13477:50-922(-)